MSQLDIEKEVAAANKMLTSASVNEQYEWLVDKLYSAFSEARRGKLDTVNEQRFEENREIELIRLAEEVQKRTYMPERSVAFIITNPTPREIFAASFRDRVIHHFLIQQSGSFWDKRLSSRSFSCREGKGVLYGVRYLENDIRQATKIGKEPAWVMKIDIQGYFMSLPRQYLFERVCWGLNRQFKDGGYVYDICKFLWGQIIFDDPLDGVRLKGLPSDWDILPPSKSMFHSEKNKGIVIGNLTSQWISNMALDPLDRFVQFELGCKWYGRYVDDAYFVAHTKDELIDLRVKVTQFISAMGLTIHPKKFYLQPVNKGIEFLGVVIYPGRTVLAKRLRQNMRQLKRDIDKFGLSKNHVESVRVYQGLSVHYNHKKTLVDIFGNQILREVSKWYYSS
jgi:hypothetical protein